MTDNRKQLSASNFRLDTTPEAISDFIESVEIAIPGTKMSKALQNRFHHMHLRTAMLQRQNDFKKEKVKAYRSQLPDPKEKLEKLREREKTVDEKISEKKQEKMAQQQAKSSYLERHRHVVKMTHRQSIIEEEKKGFIVRRQLKEEKLLEDILQDSFKRQREQRIEEQKLNQEREKAVREGEKKRKEARLKYLRDQISVLEEQLQEIKREEELAKKAKNEVFAGHTSAHVLLCLVQY
ncbi:hypothetical protein BKA69DRAFT_667358 [Paraphysoderma sedebokerense]|nr:hypothetical protein BKA69DRAFT_667358 [Paraphysoderma sedebokerense]